MGARYRERASLGVSVDAVLYEHKAVRHRPRHEPMRPMAASTRRPRCLQVQDEHLRHDLLWTGLFSSSGGIVRICPSHARHAQLQIALHTPPGHQSTGDMGEFESLGPLLEIKLTTRCDGWHLIPA